ncbi:hypothetical protein JCM10449v2_005016 [Rhodotorula kratochvilovae]
MSSKQTPARASIATAANKPAPVKAIVAPMKRPGYGQVAARKIQIDVNCFKVMPPDVTVHHYDVKITPKDEKRPIAFNRRIWRYCVENEDELVRVAIAFDGRGMAYSPQHVADGSWTFELPDEDDSTEDPAEPKDQPAESKEKAAKAGKRRSNRFTVKLSYIRPIQLGALRSFVRGNSVPGEAMVMSSIQARTSRVSRSRMSSLDNYHIPPAVNIILQHGPNLFYPTRGAKFFIHDSPAQAKAFEMWKGYYSSLRPGIGGGFLNLDLAWQPFFKPGNLGATILEVANLDGRLNDLGNIPPQMVIKLSRMLQGLKFTLTVTRQDGRPVKRKVRAITRESAQDFQFDSEIGRTNVADYFLREYGVQLVHPEWPCVLGSKRARYPLELCSVDYGQRYTPDLTPQQVTDMLRITTIKPRERLAMLKRGIEVISPSNNQAFGQFGLEISTTPIRLEARVLPPPKISFAQNRSVVPQGGTWDLTGKRFIQPARLDSWIVFVFARQNEFPPKAVQTVVFGLVQQLMQLDVTVSQQQPAVHYADVSPAKAAGFLRGKINGQPGKGGPAQLLLCLVKSKPSPYYGPIKLFGDVQEDIVTQCMVINKARSGGKSYFENLALKVNVKLGGMNSIASLGATVNVPTVVFGIDVSHPMPGSTAPSVVGVVASMDESINRYASRMATQKQRVEIIVNLADLVESLLQQFRQEVNVKPERLIFFRDGVSEGEYAQVLTHEVDAIRLACQKVDPDFKPAITFIVCGKKHHISLFPASQKDSDGKTGNVPAGTVVDHTITSPFMFDWYTQSHASLLGTSRSSHMTVLVDDSRFSADDLQVLCHNICYSYARCTRAVSLPTPAYYADLVCARGSLYLAQTGKTTLDGIHADQACRLFFM